MNDAPKHRPGDGIIERYCPDLSAEERELAHTRLRNLAKVLIGIHKRLVEEDIHRSDSRESIADGRIQPTPPSSP
ncbi:hypothetical protein U1839_26305 [Sphingomonas sp. RT2P30]|uniref:hypothetical protein n=1 Tax=Parasphingomonas halimpatiens TaxID=3096162 RepID=UPI002FCBD3FC